MSSANGSPVPLTPKKDKAARLLEVGKEQVQAAIPGIKCKIGKEIDRIIIAHSGYTRTHKTAMLIHSGLQKIIGGQANIILDDELRRSTYINEIPLNTDEMRTYILDQYYRDKPFLEKQTSPEFIEHKKQFVLAQWSKFMNEIYKDKSVNANSCLIVVSHRIFLELLLSQKLNANPKVRFAKPIILQYS